MQSTAHYTHNAMRSTAHPRNSLPRNPTESKNLNPSVSGDKLNFSNFSEVGLIWICTKESKILEVVDFGFAALWVEWVIADAH